jgi:hypothetical protein
VSYVCVCMIYVNLNVIHQNHYNYIKCYACGINTILKSPHFINFVVKGFGQHA